MMLASPVTKDDGDDAKGNIVAKNSQNEKKAPSRGDYQQAMVYWRKAKRIAKSQGKPALIAYIEAHAALKLHFAKDIRKLVDAARMPKPANPAHNSTPKPATNPA